MPKRGGAGHRSSLTRTFERPFPIRPGRSPKTAFSEALPQAVPGSFLARYPAASLLEYQMYWWLQRKGRMEPGVDFAYQDPVLGGRMPGGQVLDFVVLDRTPPLAIYANGDFWHFGGSTGKLQASYDAVENVRQILGYDGVIVWESEFVLAPDAVMRLALEGIETPLAGAMPR